MQTYDEKVDTAVHVAFEALGLSVVNHVELACGLNDFIAQEFQFVVTGDEDDEPAAGASLCDAARDAGGQGDD